MCRNSIALSPVLVHRSVGYITPPVSRSVIHRTAVWSFPRSTRIWHVLALCSSDSSLWAAVSYCAHVHRVSSTNIPWRPTSQASSRFYTIRWIAWDAVTCWACCRITV